MTDFETQCNRCPDKIWMAQDTNGAWHPMDLADHSLSHVHNKDKTQPVLGDPNYVSNPKLVPQAENRVREIVHEETKILPIDILAPLDVDKLANTFKTFEDFKNRLLSPDDSVQIQNKRFLKKSAWRKWALACGVSDELVSNERVPVQGLDETKNFYYRVIVRAFHNPTGRSAIGVAVASLNEKAKWAHPEHDVFSLCHTRAKSRAISDLVGGGEVSAEELSSNETA